MNNNVVDYEGSGALAQACPKLDGGVARAEPATYVTLGGVRAGRRFQGEHGFAFASTQRQRHRKRRLHQALRRSRRSLEENQQLGFGEQLYRSRRRTKRRDYLKDDDSLTHLNLYMNELANDGCAAIAEALKDNKKIESLDIGGNNIGAFGAEKLAEALRDNGALETLELGYNPIGVPGGKALAETVKFHGKLNTMRMGWCKIGKEGGYAFADAIKHSPRSPCWICAVTISETTASPPSRNPSAS